MFPTFALAFPGQGSQSVGMAAALVERSRPAARVFERADAALGEPISRLAFEGPEDRLNQTENAQPALLAASIAYLEAIRERWTRAGLGEPRPIVVSGHSMGQYSALVAAGSLGLEDAVRLVRERGRLMQASGRDAQGRMAAVIGLDDERLPEVLARAGAAGVVTVANRNSPGQVVLSGERRAIETAAAVARELGARRAVELPVSVAAHSPLMADAATGLRAILDATAVAGPEPALLANADAHPITTADGVRSELVGHLTSGVDWVAVVQAMVRLGATTIVEVGPGRVLTGLTRRIAADVDAIATDDPSSADRLAVPFVTGTPA